MGRSRILPLVLVSLLAAWLPGGAARAGDASRPMIVKIHADWCSTCAKLEATFRALENQLHEQALLVVLDVTDHKALEASRAEADRLGIRAFLDAHQSETGTVGVLDTSGRAVTVLRGVLDPAAYLDALGEVKGGGAS